jgi:hypothetical protein
MDPNPLPPIFPIYHKHSLLLCREHHYSNTHTQYAPCHNVRHVVYMISDPGCRNNSGWHSKEVNQAWPHRILLGTAIFHERHAHDSVHFEGVSRQWLDESLRIWVLTDRGQFSIGSVTSVDSNILCWSVWKHFLHDWKGSKNLAGVTTKLAKFWGHAAAPGIYDNDVSTNQLEIWWPIREIQEIFGQFSRSWNGYWNVRSHLDSEGITSGEMWSMLPSVKLLLSI